MKKLSLVLGIAVLFLSACKKNLPDVGSTAAQSVANEWWVTLTVGGSDVFGIGHTKLLTYNTADNTGSIWVDDQKNGYGFKVKAAVDYSNLTFKTNGMAHSPYYVGTPNFPDSARITEGKVLVGAGRSKTGNVTDSIYMKIEFSDDPGDIWEIKGHARTRFSEDEY